MVVSPRVDDESRGARGSYSMKQTRFMNVPTSQQLSEFFMAVIYRRESVSQQGEGSLRRKEDAV